MINRERSIIENNEAISLFLGCNDHELQFLRKLHHIGLVVQ